MLDDGSATAGALPEADIDPRYTYAEVWRLAQEIRAGRTVTT